MMTLEYIRTSDNFDVIYWGIAFVMSVFWGLYGIMDEANKDCEVEIITERIGKVINYTKTQTKYIGKNYSFLKACKKIGILYGLGAFVSDFTWSFIGWCSLYLLLSQYCDKDLATLNIFLGIVAVVGITGYGFKIPEKMKVG
ncbi:MAG: hypothetical protein PHQ22_01455 [Sulfuricurvum sp.]|nr:hypothetical protein [Sulfuricurvum sp.]MDD5385846.1 hypothetical protein [Sulfuricurvum sp.]